MELAKLILAYIQTLAWPGVTVFALLVFRKPLVEILTRLRGAELPGGVSLDFGQEVRHVEALSLAVAKAPQIQRGGGQAPVLPLTEANSRMITLGLQPSPSGLDLKRYQELSEQDPNLALAALRTEIEIITRNMVKGFKLEARENDSASSLLRLLLSHNAITLDQYELIQHILRLCNAAVQGKSVSQAQAESIIKSAGVLSKDYLAWLSWGFGDGWAPAVHRAG
jgi:hypothetical protein